MKGAMHYAYKLQFSVSLVLACNTFFSFCLEKKKHRTIVRKMRSFKSIDDKQINIFLKQNIY